MQEGYSQYSAQYLQKIRRKMRELEAEKSDLRREIESLDVQIERLNSALEVHQLIDPAPANEDPEMFNESGMTLPQRIDMVLTQSRNGLDTAGIHHELQVLGPVKMSSLVSTLSRMYKSGELYKEGRLFYAQKEHRPMSDEKIGHILERTAIADAEDLLQDLRLPGHAERHTEERLLRRRKDLDT